MRECPKCEACFDDDVGVCPAEGAETRPSLPGPRLLGKRYLIENRIGRGAMGQVYLALDTNLGTRRVAVKTVRQDILGSEQMGEMEAIARFEREAKSAASVQHPHVVSVTDYGETEDGVFFLVMEYVEGESLHRLLRREGTLSLRRSAKLLRQIVAGVGAAHAAGILHRDLKPANIFIMSGSKTGEDGFVKVGDFGLAKIVGDSSLADSEAGPASRGIIGTPEFMSPEQMQPELGIDVRSDLYALGTIAYLMLGGRTPFVGDLMQLVMQKIMHPAPNLSVLRQDVPSDVEGVIMRALETDPAARHEDVASWMEDLDSAIARHAESGAPSGAARLVVLGPAGAEVYVDDERAGSVGGSGRLVLASLPPGRHVLRISHAGGRDDERLIELRAEAGEQVIQAQLRPAGGGSGDGSGAESVGAGRSSMGSVPSIVACAGCGSRFASGVKFCGRCGGRSFVGIEIEAAARRCPRCSEGIRGEAKFCGRCGFVLAGAQPQTAETTRRVCVGCGTVFPDGVRFCGKCGSAMG